jgi:hypothetical protein
MGWVFLRNDGILCAGKPTRRGANMQEITIRKYHRYLGLILLPFMAVQTFTGLLFSVQYLTMPPLFDLSPEIRVLHYSYELTGNVYRIILGLVTLIQAYFGLLIYFRIRARSRRK